ncbi:hypothetical protein [Metabacillus indicus]|nr:hypothetical protein [Metabacillus indicus]
MEQKPMHYDGSIQAENENASAAAAEDLQITDEMRKNIGFNPYFIEKNE